MIQAGHGARHEVRELGACDHDRLLALSRTSSTGSERFRVDRAPDFFALGAALGETRYHGVFAEGALVACLAVSEQQRFVAGEVRRVAYVHDVRVAPRMAGRGLLSGLIRALSELYRARFPWVFNTVLGDNPHARAVRAAGARFGAEHLLGESLHVGLPVVRGGRVRYAEVESVPAPVAWHRYLQLSQKRDFAPADRARFMAEPGECLVLRSSERVLAVAKWLDQSRARRIVSSRALELPERLVSSLFALRGAAPLAGKEETLRVAYLSHFAGELAPRRAAEAFADHMARSQPGQHSHVFFGATPAAAAEMRGLGVVQLRSTSFGYGAVPPGLALDFRELSWI
jgi:hypothetical protein